MSIVSLAILVAVVGLVDGRLVVSCGRVVICFVVVRGCVVLGGCVISLVVIAGTGNR